jgi:hypothetical protein
MAVMVTNIFEKRLVMLFTKGLVKPLGGWVKAFRPTTLQDAIMRTHDMEDAVPKNAPMKPFIPQKGKEMNPFHKSRIGKDRMDEDTQRELRRKNLCFSCKEPWESGHQCMGKGKVHYIEVLFDEDDDGEDEVVHTLGSRPSSDKVEPPHLKIQ